MFCENCIMRKNPLRNNIFEMLHYSFFMCATKQSVILERYYMILIGKKVLDVYTLSREVSIWLSLYCYAMG